MFYFKKISYARFGGQYFFLKKIILLFRRDVLNGYKVIVKAYIGEKLFILNECCSFVFIKE